nr:VOC family protein [Pseudonocardia sp. TRM90224]
MIEFDHVALPARDAERSARFLADLLGGVQPRPEGPDGDMSSVPVGDGAMLLYMTVGATDDIPRGHLALRVDPDRFAGVVAGLRERGIAFGNNPAEPENGETTDCLGEAGRLYFSDPDGHLLEVVTPAR